MKQQMILSVVVASLLGNMTRADEPAPPQDFRFGADERIRQEYFDHVPNKADTPPYAKQGENNYFRFRTRLWMEQDLSPEATFRVRVVNESRSWNYPDVSQRPQRSTSEWPDELVFDNLYLDARNLAGGSLDLRIGRQDLNYGDNFVLNEGTPGDGSRTLYFNAVKATWKAIPKTEMDVFGIYNESEDELAVNSADRDLSGFPRAGEGVTESGGGLYLRNKSNPDLPLEAYAIYKREGAYEQTAAKNADGAFIAPSVAWQTLDEPRGVIKNAQNDTETLGVRLMPVFSETVKGNLELAGQLGRRGDADMHGFMANAYLVKSLTTLPSKPSFKAGVLCLSGNDPATEDDEGWNPLWARSPQWSEVVVITWELEESVNRWSNLLAPSVEVSATPCAPWKTTASLYYLSALEKDGSGGGRERGWLAKWRNEFTLAENWLAKKDKLTSHILLEALDPGDYYTVDDTAVYARWEVAYAF